MYKCSECRNALFIGCSGKYNGYLCSKSVHIEDNCFEYQFGNPREENFVLQISDLPEIRTGIGKPLLEQAAIDGYKEMIDNFATNTSDRYPSPLEHFEDVIGIKYAHAIGRQE